jgi:hypothetical protein
MMRSSSARGRARVSNAARNDAARVAEDEREFLFIHKGAKSHRQDGGTAAAIAAIVRWVPPEITR